MFDSIESAERRLSELDGEREDVLAWVKARKDELFKQEHGVGVGDLVVGRTGRVFKVTEIESHEMEWLKGVPRNNNGTFSKRAQYLLSDWEPLDA